MKAIQGHPLILDHRVASVPEFNRWVMSLGRLSLWGAHALNIIIDSFFSSPFLLTSKAVQTFSVGGWCPWRNYELHKKPQFIQQVAVTSCSLGYVVRCAFSNYYFIHHTFKIQVRDSISLFSPLRKGWWASMVGKWDVFVTPRRTVLKTCCNSVSSHQSEQERRLCDNKLFLRWMKI